MICADPSLSGLDLSLDLAESRLRLSRKDAAALAADHRQWRRKTRDVCKTPYCLLQVYQARIEAIEARVRVTDARRAASIEKSLALQRVNEAPLTNEEAQRVCRELAALADGKALGDLAVPAMPAGDVSDEEWDRLRTGDAPHQYGAATSYRLRLTSDPASTRFAQFATGGSCPSLEVFGVQRLLDSNGKDEGIDEVPDPNEQIRWSYWDGGDYPIFHRNRNFMVTTSLSDPNKLYMVSWIKPDGRVRRLCLLSPKIDRLEVRKAAEPAVCNAIARQTINPIKGSDITQQLPFNSLPSRRDEFEARYGEYADSLTLLRVDIDGSGKPKELGLFKYASASGCGSEPQWLRVLSQDHGQSVKGPLNTRLQELGNTIENIYKVNGRYYIRRTQGITIEATRVQRGGNRQACEFEERTSTSVDQFFDVGL